MKYVPVSEGKNPDILAILCVIAAAISCASSWLVQSYSWLFQLLAVIFLTVGLYVAVRYKLMHFEYRIDPCQGAERLEDISYDLAARTMMNMQPEQLEFTVWRRKGKQAPGVECRFFLSELVACEALTGGRRKRKQTMKAYPGMRLYTYTVSMDPPSPYLLVFRADGYGTVGVLIESEETMASLLKKTAEKQVAAKAADEK